MSDPAGWQRPGSMPPPAGMGAGAVGTGFGRIGSGSIQAPSAPMLPGLPPGANPETYQLDLVTNLLKKAAYLSIFSRADPNRPNVPIPSPNNPSALIGVEVNEDLHRFDIAVRCPTKEGFPVDNRIGEAVARVHIRWMVIPDSFEAAPGREPPPTELDPTCSQRFAMLDGQMTFRDRKGSGFRAFGTGRTFPIQVAGQPQLRIGAVINILEGFGSFAGLEGTVVVNGYITPPNGLALSFIVRLVDPTDRLRAKSTLSPLSVVPNPDPDTVFLTFLGQPDPDRPTTLNVASDGRVLGSNVHELLRLAHVSFDLGSGLGVRSRTTEGPIVGTLSGTLSFNPADPRLVAPIQTTNGLFSFFDRQGCPVATLRANVVEGRAFRTILPGASFPVFRFGGFGPFLSGTGLFADIVGMMSFNAIVSVFPRTLSNLYVLRVSDPEHRFRGACRAAWT